MSVDEYFATGPSFERAVFDAVVAALVESVGPVHVEPVSVGIFLKRAQTFAQLRPMTQWVAVSFSLRREVRHPLITRKVIPHGSRYFHVVNVRSPEEVDDDIVAWLTEAYHQAPA
jgi:hypothetical protein